MPGFTEQDYEDGYNQEYDDNNSEENYNSTRKRDGDGDHDDLEPESKKKKLNNYEGAEKETEFSVLVKNVPLGTQEAELKDHFSSCGEIVKVKTKAKAHWAFLHFATQQGADNALNMNDSEFRFEKISVLVPQDKEKQRELTAFVKVDGTLEEGITEDDIRKLFSQELIDAIENITIPQRKHNRGPKSQGFVQFKSKEDVQKAIAQSGSGTIKGQSVTIEASKPRSNEKPIRAYEAIIKNLLPDTSRATIEDHFTDFGVDSVLKRVDKQFAFISFTSEDGLENAIREKDGSTLDGSIIQMEQRKYEKEERQAVFKFAPLSDGTNPESLLRTAIYDIFNEKDQHLVDSEIIEEIALFKEGATGMAFVVFYKMKHLARVIEANEAVQVNGEPLRIRRYKPKEKRRGHGRGRHGGDRRRGRFDRRGGGYNRGGYNRGGYDNSYRRGGRGYNSYDSYGGGHRDSYNRGGDSYGRGGDSYGRGGDSYGRGGDSYGRGGDSYGRGGDSYGRGGDSYGRGGDSYGRGGDSYGRSGSRGGDSYGRGGDSYSRNDAYSGSPNAPSY
eukprot:CAMPEP_0117431076 /NCGR_PEP_ID=MMETSP0758-20121206/10625_1 /TAXON_ID=63605 /ORGANISM="Percolomonas cosmopolitus, Strain AE-1 (ATCC 50343)" /LENGTH=556 /DNA_ID=CAMNT_0005219753 /DNA_START=6 /DNA_END=1676 /DNA_ORIENTATION=+